MTHRRLLAVLFSCLLVLSGCAGLDVGTQPAGDSSNVTVTDVVDGDTVDVRYSNGSTERVRLLGVDTPEVHVATDPDEYEGIPNTTAGRECLRSAGDNASAFVRDAVAGETVRIETDPQSDRRGSYGRLLAYVYHEGENLNYRLVATGHARVYKTGFSERSRFDEAQAEAKADGVGLWRCQR